jgi:hypothetical protein
MQRVSKAKIAVVPAADGKAETVVSTPEELEATRSGPGARIRIKL